MVIFLTFPIHAHAWRFAAGLALILLLPVNVQGHEKELKKMLALLETQQQETQAMFDKQAQTLNELHENLGELTQEIRANAAGLDRLKSHVEDNAVRLYENLSRAMGDSEKIQKIHASLDEINTKLRYVRLKQPRQGEKQGAPASDQQSPPVTEQNEDYPLGLLLATLLVFLAPLGFTLLEVSQLERWAAPFAGMRNLLVWIILFLAYFGVGYGLMYSPSNAGWIGSTVAPPAANAQETPGAFLLYQLGLIAMLGMIVTTTLSDRLSLAAYALIALALSIVVYPAFGHWVWSGHLIPGNKGWLETLGFKDFGGATVIHSLAAWFALVWAWSFRETRTFEERESASQQLYPHNMIYALLGFFMLWLTWMGLGIGQAREGGEAALLVIKMSLAAATAGLVAFVYGMTLGRKVGVYNEIYIKTVGGALGGLVAITAALDTVTPLEAVLIGGVAGLLHPLGYRVLNRFIIKNDNAAANLIAAHGACGVWGTLAVALLGTSGTLARPDFKQLIVQMEGVLAAFLFSVLAAFIVLLIYRGCAKLAAGKKEAKGAPPTGGFVEEVSGA